MRAGGHDEQSQQTGGTPSSSSHLHGHNEGTAEAGTQTLAGQVTLPAGVTLVSDPEMLVVNVVVAPTACPKTVKRYLAASPANAAPWPKEHAEDFHRVLDRKLAQRWRRA